MTQFFALCLGSEISPFLYHQFAQMLGNWSISHNSLFGGANGRAVKRFTGNDISGGFFNVR
jgi:hypothetical protein